MWVLLRVGLCKSRWGVESAVTPETQLITSENRKAGLGPLSPPEAVHQSPECSGLPMVMTAASYTCTRRPLPSNLLAAARKSHDKSPYILPFRSVGRRDGNGLMSQWRAETVRPTGFWSQLADLRE